MLTFLSSNRMVCVGRQTNTEEINEDNKDFNAIWELLYEQQRIVDSTNAAAKVISDQEAAAADW